MKKARMNISHSRFILSKLKIFGEIVTTYKIIPLHLAFLPLTYAAAPLPLTGIILSLVSELLKLQSESV